MQEKEQSKFEKIKAELAGLNEQIRQTFDKQEELDSAEKRLAEVQKKLADKNSNQTKYAKTFIEEEIVTPTENIDVTEENASEENELFISQEKLDELFEKINIVDEFLKLKTSESILVSNDISQNAEKGQLQKAAIDAFTEKFPEGVEVDTIIGNVNISSRSIRESLAHTIYNSKADAVLSLFEGIKNAAYIGKLQDFEGNGIINHYFAYSIQYEGERRYVFCRVREQPFEERRFYIHDIFSDKEIIEKINTLSQTQPPANGQVQLRGVAPYRAILTNFFAQGNKNSETTFKNSQIGDGSAAIINLVDDKNLTEQQKLLQQFGKSVGANVVFFNNANKDFHGAYL